MLHPDGAKLNQVAIKLQTGLKALTSTQQQDPLTALGNPDRYTILIAFLKQRIMCIC